MSIRNRLVVALLVLLAPAVVVAQGITIPNTFVNGTAADATQVNANFSSLANNALNRTLGVMTGLLTTVGVAPTVDNTSDLGTASLMYRSLYTKTSLVFGATGGNYTLSWANPAAARAISFEDPGGTDILVYKAATQTLTNKTISGTSTFNAGAVTSSGSIQGATSGSSHALGAGVYGYSQIRLMDGGSTFTAPGTGDAVYGILAQPKIQAGASKDAYALSLGSTLINASGTGALFAGLKIDAPSLTISAGAITKAATVYISGAPSGATNNYALNVNGGASLFGGTVLSSGQPGFLVRKTSSTAGVASGTTISFDTEIYDETSNFAAGTTFTAPVTGRYLLTISLSITPSVSATVGLVVVTSNRTYFLDSFTGTAGYLSGSVIADMDTSDTVSVNATTTAGTMTYAQDSFFSGRLLP